MADVTPMEAMISNITSFVTAAIGWITDFAEMVVADPLLLLMVVTVPLAGFGIGGLKRLTRL